MNDKNLLNLKVREIEVDEALWEVLSLMGENKNRLTGVSADNKSDD